MIIEYVQITKKNTRFSCEFKDRTHIFSVKNTQGKTTLIRFIIYGLGFNVPITHDIKGGGYVVKLFVRIKGQSFELIRKGNNVEVKTDSIQGSRQFPISDNNYTLLSFLFGCENKNIFSNILGTFYIDQESGWLVFNRGKIIKGQEFDIDQLVYSLCRLDETVFHQRKVVEREIAYNTRILNQFASQPALYEYSMKEKELDTEIVQLQQSIAGIQDQLDHHRRVRKSFEALIHKNNELWKLIDSLHLNISYKGEIFELKGEHIYSFNETKGYHTAKISQENIIITKLTDELESKKNKLREMIADRSLDAVLYNKGVRKAVKIDREASESNLGILKAHKKVLQDEIDRKVSDESYKDLLNSKLIEFSEAMGVDHLLNRSKLIFDNDFDKITGTEKQKLILAYRCACLVVMSDYLGVRLPLIIDSISRETDKDSIDSMLSFFSQKIPDHQLIISTIVDIEDMHRVDITYPLLKEFNVNEGNQRIC